MFFPTACCDGGKERGGKEKKKRGVDVWKQKKRGGKSVFETANLADVDQVGVGFGLLSTKLRHDSVKR